MTQNPAAALVEMLERRERTARKAYRVSDAVAERAEHDHGYRDDRAVVARLARQRAAERWTEAQEALSEARKLVQP